MKNYHDLLKKVQYYNDKKGLFFNLKKKIGVRNTVKCMYTNNSFPVDVLVVNSFKNHSLSLSLVVPAQIFTFQSLAILFFISHLTVKQSRVLTQCALPLNRALSPPRPALSLFPSLKDNRADPYLKDLSPEVQWKAVCHTK